MIESLDLTSSPDVLAVHFLSLTDPCLDVAVGAASVLHSHYDLAITDDAGEAISPMVCGSGPPEGHYAVDFRYLDAVATELHNVVPQYVTDGDLDLVRQIRIPPDEWWMHEYGSERDIRLWGTNHWREMKREYRMSDLIPQPCPVEGQNKAID
jgi:hypothetical protein